MIQKKVSVPAGVDDGTRIVWLVKGNLEQTADRAATCTWTARQAA